jgi:hypothetical protein
MLTLEHAPSYYQWLARQPGRGAVVELPVWGAVERYRMFFGMIHGRPMVDGESGLLPPSMGWVSHQSFLSGAAAAHLERLRSSGLEFAVLHTYLLNAAGLEAYRSALQLAGASPVSSAATVEIWRFPQPPAVRPFGIDTTLAVLRAAPGAYEGSPLQVTIGLAPRGPEPVYEFRVRRLALIAEGEGISFRRDIFLVPPLLAAAVPDLREVAISLPRSPWPIPLRLRVVDEEGRPWATLETQVHVVSPDEWRALEPRFEVGECRIAIVGSAANARTQRWIVRIDASDRATWAGPALRYLRVVDRSTATPLFFDKLPAMAGGSSTFVSVETGRPSDAEIDFMVTDAAGTTPNCVTGGPGATRGR